MKALAGIAVVAVGLLMGGCGGSGGGSGTSAMTAVSGAADPPASAPEVVSYSDGYGYVSATTLPNLLIPPNVGSQGFAALLQGSLYSVDGSVSSLPITESVVYPVVVTEGIGIATGNAYSGDASLGQWISFYTPFRPGIGGGDSASLEAPHFDTWGGMPAAIYPWGSAAEFASVLPASATLNPAGYTYQGMGGYADAGTGKMEETWFSFGIPTKASTLPTSGTATYAGRVIGTFINAGQRTSYDLAATINATVNFGTRTVTFSTSDSTNVVSTAPSGTTPAANAALNLSGTLSYAADSNTATGVVTAGNGMKGNATLRFSGPGISSATASKAAGSPPEVGGTFAVLLPMIGSLQGAFGAN